MEHKPKNDELTDEQRMEAQRLYLVTDHVARGLTLLSLGDIAVTVMITAQFQGAEGSLRPITVGSTSSHGSAQARAHMEGCANVIADANSKLVAKIAEIEKLEAQQKAAEGEPKGNA